MKIFIMGFAKLKVMPYLNFYLDQIDTAEHDVHILYWNRDGKPEPLKDGITYYEFKQYQEDDVAKYSKIGNFLKYRNKAKKILEDNEFDMVIVLHTIPGVLVKDCLRRNYRNRFILDYRDITYERIGIYKKIIHELVNMSFATFVSSDAFRKYLPDVDKIYTSHNLLKDSLEHRMQKHTRKGYPIKMAFWGMIRHENTNREIIKKVCNDERLELHYYGREQAIALSLKKYVQELNAGNIFFHGEYSPEDRYEFIKNVDVVHNIYGLEELPPAKDAMGNKFYDGIIFRLPQLCMKGSLMGDLSEKYNVGFQCNPFDENFVNDICKYYDQLDPETFDENCDELLEKIMKEYDEGRDVINNAIRSKHK